MNSYLPPGCSSADGGIDHAFESAVEALTDAVSGPEMLHLFTAIAPAVNAAMTQAWRDGYDEGRMAGLQEAALKKESPAA